MIEVDSKTALATQLLAAHNQLMNQFSILGVQQPEALVNAVQQAPTWYEIYGNSHHTVNLSSENPESMNIVSNAQKSNYGNADNQKQQTQPMYPQGYNQKKYYQQYYNNSRVNNIEEILKKISDD